MKLISIMFILSVFSLSFALVLNKVELSNSQEFDKITVNEIHVNNKIRMSNGDSTVFMQINKEGHVLFKMRNDKNNSSFEISLIDGYVLISSKASQTTSLSMSNRKIDSNILLTTDIGGGVITLSGTDSMSVISDKGLSLYDQSVVNAKLDLQKTKVLEFLKQDEKDINNIEKKWLFYQKLLKTPKKSIRLDKLEE